MSGLIQLDVSSRPAVDDSSNVAVDDSGANGGPSDKTVVDASSHDPPVRSTNDLLEKLLTTVQGLQASMEVLVQNTMPKDIGYESDGKSWPEANYDFTKRFDDVKRNFDFFTKELIHLEEHYRMVGGGEKMIDSSVTFRSNLSDFLKAVQTVLNLQGDANYEDLEGVRSSMRNLSNCFTSFRDSLYFQKHAFYFEAVKHCHDILVTTTNMQDSRSQKEFRKPRTHLNYLFNEFFPKLESAMHDVVIELRSFREKSIPSILNEDKERATTRYIYITTIATFFSSVTATTLQYSFQDTSSTQAGLVNLFWFISLIFSVSSGINSLLGLTWRKSVIFQPESTPIVVRLWLEKAPLVFLIIAAITFVVGLNLFAYVSSQRRFVSLTTNVFTFAHGLCLVVAVMWYLCRLKYDKRWALWTKRIGTFVFFLIVGCIYPFVAVATLIVSTLYGIVILQVLGVKLFFIKLRLLLAKIKKPSDPTQRKGRYRHILRSIYWALGRDDCVARVNISMSEVNDWPDPNHYARSVRAIVFPIKTFPDRVRNVMSSFRQYVEGQNRDLSLLAQENEDHAEDSSERSMTNTTGQGTWMDAYRQSLSAKLGNSDVVQKVIDTVRPTDSWLYIDHVREDKLRSRLGRLLWGYQELVDEVYAIRLTSSFSTLPRIPPDLALSGIIVTKEGSMPGGTSDVYEGRRGRKRVALKVMRVHGSTTVIKVVIEAMALNAVTWKQLHHCNILPFLGFSSAVVSSQYHLPPAMVFPYMKNRTLPKYLEKYAPRDRLALTLGVARGLQYLHNFDPVVVHGDLRAANVMIDDNGQPRITDIGIAWVYEPQHSNVDNATRWQAPELLTAEQVSPTTQSDIYAYACVCVEIFSGKQPFHELQNGVVLAVINNNIRPSRLLDHTKQWGLTDEVWDLIQSCWVTSPADRTGMNTVVIEIENIKRQRDTLDTLERGLQAT